MENMFSDHLGFKQKAELKLRIAFKLVAPPHPGVCGDETQRQTRVSAADVLQRLKENHSFLFPSSSPDSSGAVTVAAGPSSRVAEGETLRLACCSPAAGPQAGYTWFQSTGVGPRRRGQVWDISRVTSADSGGYVCQIQSGDAAQNSTVLTIDVECKSPVHSQNRRQVRDGVTGSSPCWFVGIQTLRGARPSRSHPPGTGFPSP